MLGNKEIMARNIQHYLDITNKTRMDVCKDLGFAYSTFSDWVNASKYPRIDKIEMMANYFGITKADLVEDQDLAAVSSRVLSPEESALLDDYQKLNAEGKKEVRNHMDYVRSQERYAKDTGLSVQKMA